MEERTKLINNIFLIIFQIPLIIIIEIIFGDWIKNKPHVATIPGATYSLKINSKPNLRWGKYTENIITYTRDELGYRGWESRDNKENIPLVLTIGASDVDQKFETDSNTWSEILERRLKINGISKIDVINAGVDGHSSYGHNFSIPNWHDKSLRNYKKNIKVVIIYTGQIESKLLHRDEYFLNESESNLKNVFDLIRKNSFFIQNLQNLKNVYITKSMDKIKSDDGEVILLRGYDKTRDWEFKDYYNEEIKTIDFSNNLIQKYSKNIYKLLKTSSESFPNSQIILIQPYAPGCIKISENKIITRLPPEEKFSNYCHTLYKTYALQSNAVLKFNSNNSKKIYLHSMYKFVSIDDNGYYDEGHPIGIASEQIGNYLGDYIFSIIEKDNLD